MIRHSLRANIQACSLLATALTLVVTAPAALGQMNYPCKCSRKPSYHQSAASFGTPAVLNGQVAISTTWAKGFGSLLANQTVIIRQINPVGGAVAGQNWATNQYYSDGRWNVQALGDVFGLTLDNAGNLYVAAAGSTVYSWPGAPGPARTGYLANPQCFNGTCDHGQIYRIPNNTGTPEPFFQLPQKYGAGLGNLTYECDTNSFYVTNFDDGLIYQLAYNKFGKLVVRSTWDHGMGLTSATDALGNALNRANIPAQSGKPAQLGRRPWAVRVQYPAPYSNASPRLFYSVWNMDSGHPGGPYPNEIWSIGLASDGSLAGPARLEVSMPLLDPAVAPWNNPVSDITFTSTGMLIAAERTTGTNAYFGQSRVIQFAQSVGKFIPTPFKFSVGCVVGLGGSYANAAGGVDFDYTSTQYPIWATGYALHRKTAPYFDYVDGLQGFLPFGGAMANSLLIDMDTATADPADSEGLLGAVRIPCGGTLASSEPTQPASAQ